jgi:hypothetical protein
MEIPVGVGEGGTIVTQYREREDENKMRGILFVNWNSHGGWLTNITIPYLHHSMHLSCTSKCLYNGDFCRPTFLMQLQKAIGI